jgi:16S rRNA (cytosine967-C5)-methyltransferase
MCNKGIALPKISAAPTARQTALRILYAIDTQQAYTDVALRQALRHSVLDRRERAFITECVYGVVRWRGRIDWLLAQACRPPLASLTPWIRNALRLGAYQCLWMQRVPCWAAVHETVALAKRFGHQGTARLVNGVLRTLLRQHKTYSPPDATTQPAAHLAVTSSHPQWLVERWLQRYGWERTQALCKANNQPLGVSVRVNTLRTTAAALEARLRQEGCQQLTPAPLGWCGFVVQGSDRLEALPSYQEGLFQVQDSGAMLVAPLCQVQDGQRVLDTCAAPGGKTTHLAQLMHDTGRLLALDVRESRLRLLQDNIRRLRLTSITPLVADAAAPLPLRQKFDRILVDAPCSGFGVLRRHPDIKWRKQPAEIMALQTVQLLLLRTLLPYLEVDGMLIYSVCSNEPEETYEVVRCLLVEHPQLRLEPIEHPVLRQLSWPAAIAGTLDITPEQLGTEGVFVARFRYQRSER